MKVLVATWGPELGCVNREIPILEKIKDHDIVFYSHYTHKELLNHFFPNETKYFYSSMPKIYYDERQDLNTTMSLFSTVEFATIRFIPSFINFKKIISKEKPDIVLNDFIPPLAIYCSILNIPSYIVFNYIYQYSTNGLISRFFADALKITYSLSLHNYVETIFPEENERKKFTFISPIAKSTSMKRKDFNQELNVKKSDTIIFFSRGGSFYDDKFLKEIHRKNFEYPDIKFLLLPRTQSELKFFKDNFPNFIFPKSYIFDTYNYIGNSDLVITKCGFRTVSEAIKNKVPILPLNTSKHPEVSDTEKVLKERCGVNLSIKPTDSIDHFFNKIFNVDMQNMKKEFNKIKCNGSEELSSIINNG